MACSLALCVGWGLPLRQQTLPPEFPPVPALPALPLLRAQA